MIVTKHGFKKMYAYGDSGIFDTMANFLTRIFTSSAAKQIASFAFDVGKSVAKEGAKKALDVGNSRYGKEVSYKSRKAQIEENFTKIYRPIGTRNARH